MRKSRCFFLTIIVLITILILILNSVPRPKMFQRKLTSMKTVLEHIRNHDQTFSEYQAVLRRWQNSNGNYSGVKTILFWNTMYAEKHRHFMFGTGDIFKNCKVSYCYATPNRKLFNSINHYDAILFHGIEMSLMDLPRTRSPNQRYIYFSWESPLSRPIEAYNFVTWPNFFNWTMSYRLDSDIIRPYGIIRDIATRKIVFPPKNDNDIIKWRSPNKTYYLTDDIIKIMKGKKRLASWIVSHCKTHSKREDVVDKLKRYMAVDIFGACGEFECNRNEKEKCYENIEKKYFYYLSFENTLCKDYITEKLFNPMNKYVIPVVYGDADYSKLLPPHSYINVKDFSSIGELATFMMSLIFNPYKYSAYFWWKDYYRIEDSTKFTLCNLCKKLHDNSQPKKVLKDFQKYYTDNQCRKVD